IRDALVRPCGKSRVSLVAARRRDFAAEGSGATCFRDPRTFHADATAIGPRDVVKAIHDARKRSAAALGGVLSFSSGDAQVRPCGNSRVSVVAARRRDFAAEGGGATCFFDPRTF